MSDGHWIQYATPDGATGLIAGAQIEVVMKWVEGDLGTIHTTRGEVIKVANVSAVLAQMPVAPEPVTPRPVAVPQTPVKPSRRRLRIATVRAAFARTAARLAAS